MSYPSDNGLSKAGAQHLKLSIAFVLPLLIAIVIAGCGDQGSGTTAGQAPGANPAAAVVHVTATVAASKRVPDPPEGAESTAYAASATPQFLLSLKSTDKDKAIARYAFAVAHRQDLAQVPCFCGCALYEHAHTSLQSCYMRSVDATGQVVYTDHSVSCDICTGEVDMMMAAAPNTPLATLRDQITKKYNYTGVWTDTPPIQ